MHKIPRYTLYNINAMVYFLGWTLNLNISIRLIRELLCFIKFYFNSLCMNEAVNRFKSVSYSIEIFWFCIKFNVFGWQKREKNRKDLTYLILPVCQRSLSSGCHKVSRFETSALVFFFLEKALLYLTKRTTVH